MTKPGELGDLSVEFDSSFHRTAFLQSLSRLQWMELNCGKSWMFVWGFTVDCVSFDEEEPFGGVVFVTG